MNKTQKMKKAARNTRKKNFKQSIKKVFAYLWNSVKNVWHFICRVCNAIWNWLKSIDIVGMVNLTLLVAIIVLFTSLISDFVCCNKKTNTSNKQNVEMVVKKPVDNRKVVQRKFNTTLPLKADKKTGITPKIKTVGVKKPQVVREISVPARELPKQNLGGDVIVDVHPSAVVLQNGVNVNGNLFIQNMRKFTLPCDAKINGNLFIRNVDRLNFCGKFNVSGNIYVNRESSFGPIPDGSVIGGQIVL